MDKFDLKKFLTEGKLLKEDLANRAFELEMGFMDPSNKYGDKWQEEVAGVLLDKYGGKWENWEKNNPEELEMLLDKFKSLKETREEQYIDPYDNPDFYDEEGNMKDEAYREEFGFSFKERQDWEKILDQVKKQNNFDVFDPKSLRNYGKIEDEANQIYTQKYGSPFLKENKSLNELDSLSDVFDTITGEYEDEDGKVIYEPYAYNDLKDLLNSTFKSSRNVDDFIEKVTYSITNTTSVLSLEDQDKLHDWYDVRSEYIPLDITQSEKYRLDSLVGMDKSVNEVSDDLAGGYVEAMGPRFEKAINMLINAWEEWKMGPMTEPGMVEHAKRDIVDYVKMQLMVDNL